MSIINVMKQRKGGVKQCNMMTNDDISLQFGLQSFLFP